MSSLRHSQPCPPSDRVCPTLGGGGSHVTYPIMFLYTAIECPSASWAKFTWVAPPPELDRLTDKHV